MKQIKELYFLSFCPSWISKNVARPAVFRKRLMAFQNCKAGAASSKNRQIWKAFDSRFRKNSTSHMVWLVQTCSKILHLCILVRTCSLLFTFVNACSQLFTPVLTCSHLNDYLRFQARTVFHWVFPLRKLLFFNLTSYLADIAHFCSPNWDLSNSVRLV